MADSTHPAVAIIGAGPYGLSIGAHLRAAGVPARIFGTPMHSWRAHMPKGMFLKSEACASNLSEPTRGYTFRHYCIETGRSYAPSGAPIPLETFAAYGLAFQRRHVPAVEDVMVTALDESSDGFELRLATGETLRASRVVVATGISHAADIPAELAQLPAELRSHSGEHHDLCRFRGRDVTVIGGGQSALETAALLHEAGAGVRLLVRRPSVVWNAPLPGRRRPLYARMRHPMSDLGPGLGLWFYSNAPRLFWYLPATIRIARTRKVLGPAGAWWLRDRVVGRFPILLGHPVRRAETRGAEVLLQVQGPDGEMFQLKTDHVIAATGYRFALDSLPFLSTRVRSQLRSIQRTPVLSSNFESSMSGLYFAGLASANQFGPAMRFVLGAHYTARRICSHIAAREACLRLPQAPARSRAPRCPESLARPAVMSSTDRVAEPQGAAT